MIDSGMLPWLRRLAARHLGGACVLCAGGSAQHGLCSPCRDDLPWLAAPGCPRCAASTSAGEICGRCLSQPPAFDRVLAATEYRFPVDAMIQRFKFAGDLWLAPVLAGLVLERIDGQHTGAVATAERAGGRDPAQPVPGPQYLLPMPLSDRRLAERGFNQSGELARVLSRRLRIPVRRDLLRRGRDTVPQSGLALEARAANIRGAFIVDRPVKGLRLAVIDDVLTTGATGHEAALALKRAGAGSVEIWTVARTLLIDRH